MSQSIKLLAVGLIALGLAVTGYYAYDRWFRAAPAAAPHSPTPAPVAQGIPAVRPLFSLPDPTGKLRSITEWDGRALVVNFWATWCAPCRREIPLLNRLAHEFGPQGFQLVGVAVDFPEAVVAYLRQTPIDYPVLIGEQDGLDAAKAFGVESMAFPFTVFTDARGRIVALHLGELHEPQARAILGVVADVDAGKVDLPTARKRIETALSRPTDH
jgi:thiol-disulfide isomerase/thioredoxin